MKILLIGATGNLGSRILREAAARKHDVTAMIRRRGALADEANIHVVHDDARDAEAVALLASEHDAVVVSVSARKEGDAPIPEVVRAVATGVGRASRTRLLVVGGAGSLEVEPGVQAVDTPDFPDAFRDEARQQLEALGVLQGNDIDWVYLSPPAEIEPGERTGEYRTGGDRMLFDAEGRSRISMEDYAVAVLDELEDPKHRRERFTVAY